MNISMSKNTESIDTINVWNIITQSRYLPYKDSCILIKKNLNSKALGSGLNPRGVLDFSPLYFFSKRKIALQGN